MDKMEAERREEQKKKLDEDLKKEEDEKKKKDIADMKKKMAEDKLEALKKTPLGARAFASVTADVCINFFYLCPHREEVTHVSLHIIVEFNNLFGIV